MAVLARLPGVVVARYRPKLQPRDPVGRGCVSIRRQFNGNPILPNPSQSLASHANAEMSVSSHPCSTSASRVASHISARLHAGPNAGCSRYDGNPHSQKTDELVTVSSSASGPQRRSPWAMESWPSLMPPRPGHRVLMTNNPGVNALRRPNRGDDGGTVARSSFAELAARTLRPV